MDISIETLKKELEKYNYIAENNIIYAVYTALQLEKPLLIDGPAGVGKTELAKVIAKIFNAELIRLQCYEGIDASKVIYDINYPKQLLYQNFLNSNITKEIQDKSFDESVEILDKNTNFYGERFLIERPLLKCINPKNDYKKVLLIDEIDKTDSEIEHMLLEPLSDYSLSIPEFGTIECDPNNKPIIILTSNNNRELSEPLKRRCIYLNINYPSIEVESKIVSLKCNVELDYARDFIENLNKIKNEIELRQIPSIAETIEWIKILHDYLKVDKFSNENLKIITSTLNTLFKNKNDIENVYNYLNELDISFEENNINEKEIIEVLNN